MPIEIITKNKCPYCVQLKDTLESANVEFKEINIGTVGQPAEVPNNYVRKLLSTTDKLTVKTVPQVFIDGQFIGTGDDDILSIIELHKDPIKTIIKSSGKQVPFDVSKIKLPESITDLERIRIVNHALIKLFDKCTTKELVKTLIDVCLGLRTYEYAMIAGQLQVMDIYKRVYGSYSIPRFGDIYASLVLDGHWKQMNYTMEEIILLGEKLDHDRDSRYQYASVRQYADKYAIHNEDTNEIFESPQVTLMGIAMALFEKESDKIKRLDQISDFYDFLSEGDLNLPTPILAGYRTKKDGAASCCVITSGDDTQSIEAATHVANMMTTNRAGIGFEYAIRSHGDSVRNGFCLHKGKIQHYKKLVHGVAAVGQGARGGSACMTYTAMDPELYNLFALKVHRTPEEMKVEALDYSFAFNNEFVRRAALRLPWALVSKVDAPKLYEAFYQSDSEEFAKEMQHVLDNPMIKKTVIEDSFEILTKYLVARDETSRIYHFNVNNSNAHTPFDWEQGDAIRLSNLCQEIHLPTRPFNHMTEPYTSNPNYTTKDGLSSLCILSAWDVHNVHYMDDDQLYRLAYLTLKALDDMIDDMDNPFIQVKETSQKYRSVGIGSINLAKLLNVLGMNYGSSESLEVVHALFERVYYFLVKASVQLAKERGAFEMIKTTRWAKGWLPIDTYNRNVDDIVAPNYLYDWEALRKDVLKYGVRFSTLVAHMPTESSAVFTGANNGLYAAKAPEWIFKGPKDGLYPFFFPKVVDENGNNKPYEVCYDLENSNMIKTYAVVQKWADQGISADTYSDYSRYPSGKIPLSKVAEEFFLANKLGIKAFYYSVPRTGRGVEIMDDASCEGCSV